MLGGEENMKCRALLEETVTVPPNSGSFILVRIPGAEYLAESGLVEPTRDTKKAFIVPGLVNLNRKDVSINVLNTTTDPLTIYANQQVGNCVSFTESTDTQYQSVPEPCIVALLIMAASQCLTTLLTC